VSGAPKLKHLDVVNGNNVLYLLTIRTSHRRLISVPLFVAQEVGRTLTDDGDWMPTITIDVSTSPAVADLARVHAVEGIGDVSTSVDKNRVYIPIGNVLMPCISVENLRIRELAEIETFSLVVSR